MAGNKLLLSRPRSMDNTLLAGMMMCRDDHEIVADYDEENNY